MASELPIVTRLRSSICENKCKAMLASSGCDCAEAADLITELTEALRNVQIEAEREKGSWVHLKRVIALNCKQALAKAGGPIND